MGRTHLPFLNDFSRLAEMYRNRTYLGQC